MHFNNPPQVGAYEGYEFQTCQTTSGIVLSVRFL